MKMKKALALMLAASMALGSVGFASANPTTTAAEVPAGLERIVESGAFGVSGLRLEDEARREELTAIVLRLSGISDEEVKALNEKANFSDVASWNMGPWIGKAVKEELFMGDTGATTFRPNESAKYAEVLTVLMRALGYGEDLKGLEWPNGFMAKAAEIGLEVNADIKPLDTVKRETVAFAMEQALDVEVKGGGMTLAQKLGIEEVEATPETLEVVSVKANSAKSFQVEFNKPVTEDDKIKAEVKRLNSVLTLTETWNEEKTVLTLSSAANLAEATFTVEVKADDKEISKETIQITSQRVDKIEITSDKVAVNTTNNRGFVTYRVYDQYGNDVTNTHLANNLTFQSGAEQNGTITGKNGLITIAPAGGDSLLIQFQNVSVIIFDNKGVSKTASLPTATAIGTLQSFQLGSVEDVKLAENDLTTVFYLPYTAVDMSGNETKDYDLITGGLIDADSNTTGVQLHVSLNNYVSAQIVRDPEDNTKAAIEVRAINSQTPLSMDMPVTITAMGYAGTTSSVQTEIAKAKIVSTFNLIAPAETVAEGEKPEIQFEAYDQFGNKITRHADLAGTQLTLTNLEFERNVDGTAKLVVNTGVTVNGVAGALSEGITTLTAVVRATGSLSNVTLNVQKVAVPARVGVKADKYVPAMEHGATQTLSFKAPSSALVVYDQYDRVMGEDEINNNFHTSTVGKYKILVEAVGSVTSSATEIDSYDGTILTVNAQNGGAGTVHYKLVENVGVTVANPSGVKDKSSAAASFAVIKSTDIVDYAVTTDLSKPIYAVEDNGTATDQEKEYQKAFTVRGKTANGTNVLLARTPIVGTTLSNANDFNVEVGTGSATAVRVIAKELADPTKTGSETSVTINLFHNGKVTALTNTLKSSTVAPQAKAIVSRGTDVVNDKITMSKSDFLDMQTLNQFVVNYNSVGAATTKAPFWFRITDTYDSWAMNPAQIVVDDSTAPNVSLAISNTAGATFGQVTTATASNTVAEKVYVTAITNNGLVRTIEITVLP